MRPANYSKLFQLFILPKGDINKPTGWVICCPFTHVIAEGQTYQSALQKWKENAAQRFNCSFSVPSTNKFLSRKVLYSTTEQSEKDSVFVLDFNRDRYHLDSLVVNPAAQSVKTQQEYLAESSLGAMFDWKVFCSPVGEMQERIATKTSLNPIALNPSFY